MPSIRSSNQIVLGISAKRHNSYSSSRLIDGLVAENWRKEFAAWAPDLEIITYWGSQDERRHLRIQAGTLPLTSPASCCLLQSASLTSLIVWKAKF